MNNYEQNQCNLLASHIPAVQAFVNKNITGAKAMTAADIADKFVKENQLKITAVDFANAFRVLVKFGKITGIAGFKRVGYKRVDAAAVVDAEPDSEPEVVVEKKDQPPAREQAMFTLISPHFTKLQKFLDTHIVGSIAMTAADIIAKFCKENSLSENQDALVLAFRWAISKGHLTGIEGAKRAGYRKVGSVTKPPAVEPPAEGEEVIEPVEGEIASDEELSGKCVIVVSENRRFVGMDNKNWCYQSKSGNTWISTSYFGSSKGMIQHMATKLLDEQLKEADRISIPELLGKIDQAVNTVTSALQSALRV